MDSSLTAGERRSLAGLEESIAQGINSFRVVGNALLKIRENKLYTDVDKTFEGYCRKRWEFSAGRARQLIGGAKAAEVAESATNGSGLVVNERQARVLASLPDEQTQATVWARAVEADKRVSAAQLSKIAQEVTGKGPAKPEPKAEPKPETKHPVDANGTPIPLGLIPTFDRAGEFEGLCKQLTELAKAVEKLASDSIGVHLHAQSIVADLNNAKTAIRFGKPYAVCPYCKGGGKYKGDKCSSCKGCGFVGRNKLASAPEGMK